MAQKSFSYGTTAAAGATLTQSGKNTRAQGVSKFKVHNIQPEAKAGRQ